MSAVVLQTRDLVRKFGGFVATDHVNLSVAAGARHALIGPNGAGKTTLINLLTGYLEPSAGRVELLGEDVTTMAQHERCRRGLVRTFQINQLFADMTVLESVALAVSEQAGLGTHWWKPLAARGEVVDQAAAILERLKLLPDAYERTRNLAYGRQRLIEIALALAMQPKVLLCDEITSALDPELVNEVLAVVKQLAAEGMTLIMVTHEMRFARDVGDQLVFMHHGRIHEQGPARDVFAAPQTAELAGFIGAVH